MITPVQIAVNGKTTCRKATLAAAVAITEFSIEILFKSLLNQWLLRANTYLETAFGLKLLNSCKYPAQN
jgi:hypothetical protein